jgi:N-methylhydantoinase B
MRRSWNFPISQNEALTDFLDRCLEPLKTAAMVLQDGRSLHVRAVSPLDIATLPTAAKLCAQYLQLKEDEIAICNDPYSGGSALSEITLVTGLSLTSSSASDLFLASRFSLMPSLMHAPTVDAEGLRIPPTPIGARKTRGSDEPKWNEGILSAMLAHPLAPSDLRQTLEENGRLLLQQARRFKAAMSEKQTLLQAQALKDYLSASTAAAHAALHSLPLGAVHVSNKLPTGETIKLHLDVRDEKVLFNFSGSDFSANVQLTELMTFGACFSVLNTVLAGRLLPNAASFAVIEVSTPVKSCVNAKFPASVSRGAREGLSQLCWLLYEAFTRLNPALQIAASARGTTAYEIVFANRSTFYVSLPDGQGATSTRDGMTAWQVWLPSENRQISVEEAEVRFPIQWLSSGLRSNSGGAGQRSGGKGLMQTLCLKQPALLRWSLSNMHLRQGTDGGKAGQAAEILIRKAGGEDETQAANHGEVSLQAGDCFTVLSSGGAGYGAPTSSGEIS